MPDAWIDESVVDPVSGQLGTVGYEINFNRQFYVFEAQRSLESIDKDINECIAEITRMIGGLAK